ncbi:unnamed protein product [Hermetia illucens]|uniref:Uncharacterized protein n=1 Tax=Hermetia illucens TaxID=343691 RepID=A0A7R8UPT4_HERIL|nr:unnamed protein product [Hermetia illucens]
MLSSATKKVILSPHWKRKHINIFESTCFDLIVYDVAVRRHWDKDNKCRRHYLFIFLTARYKLFFFLLQLFVCLASLANKIVFCAKLRKIRSTIEANHKMISYVTDP